MQKHQAPPTIKSKEKQYFVQIMWYFTDMMMELTLKTKQQKHSLEPGFISYKFYAWLTYTFCIQFILHNKPVRLLRYIIQHS